MNDWLLVEKHTSIDYFLEKQQGFSFAEFPALLDKFVEIATIAKLQEEVDIIRSLREVNELHNVRMAKLLPKLDFTSQRFDNVFLSLLRVGGTLELLHDLSLRDHLTREDLLFILH